jgi:hypothetical protein
MYATSCHATDCIDQCCQQTQMKDAKLGFKRGSHRGSYERCHLLGYSAVQSVYERRHVQEMVSFEMGFFGTLYLMCCACLEIGYCLALYV